MDNEEYVCEVNLRIAEACFDDCLYLEVVYDRVHPVLVANQEVWTEVIQVFFDDFRDYKGHLPFKINHFGPPIQEAVGHRHHRFSFAEKKVVKGVSVGVGNTRAFKPASFGDCKNEACVARYLGDSDIGVTILYLP